MIAKASQEFGLSAAATAAIMKKFHWEFGEARKKYRQCDDDPFKFSAAMKVVSDLAEEVIVSDGTETVFDEVMTDHTSLALAMRCYALRMPACWLAVRDDAQSHRNTRDVQIASACLSYLLLPGDVHGHNRVDLARLWSQVRRYYLGSVHSDGHHEGLERDW